MRLGNPCPCIRLRSCLVRFFRRRRGCPRRTSGRRGWLGRVRRRLLQRRAANGGIGCVLPYLEEAVYERYRIFHTDICPLVSKALKTGESTRCNSKHTQL